MTKAQPDGKTASDIADEWSDFIRNERTCRISWGFIVSYIGYVEELEIARESEHEIAWRMKIQIDNRDDDPLPASPKSPAPMADDVATINAAFVSLGQLQTLTIPDLSPDFLDSLDNLAAALNAPSAELNKLAGQFDDIEKATFATLQHFRGALTGVRTALIGFRDTILNAGIDTVILVRSAQSDIAWARYQTDFDVQTMIVLDALGKLDRKAELAQKQDATKFVTAKEGDTWESIATRATGGPNKAGDIRSLNGIRYGEKPEPGTSYLVQ